MSAGYGANAPSYYALSGYGAAPVGTSTLGLAQAAGTQVRPGDGDLALPGKLTLGVRQRVNLLFTWEADLRYMLGGQTRLPGQPAAVPPGGGAVSGEGDSTDFRNGFGLGFMGELNLNRNWVLRIGVALDPALRQSGGVEPLAGGAQSAAFSGGFGYKALGGELSVGYQYRQTQSVDTPNLAGTWSASGYSATPTITRVEGMGHIWSVGYKRTF
jgi:long-subunit fatty acid transport protein